MCTFFRFRCTAKFCSIAGVPEPTSATTKEDDGDKEGGEEEELAEDEEYEEVAVESEQLQGDDEIRDVN